MPLSPDKVGWKWVGSSLRLLLLRQSLHVRQDGVEGGMCPKSAGARGTGETRVSPAPFLTIHRQ